MISVKTIIQRLFNLELPQGQSAFLWGARKTGKSTYLKMHFPEAVCYDLLKSDLYLRLLKEPHQLREEVLAMNEDVLKHPIIVDEVQKVPELLNEIHWLIENTSAYFILCGSSARKLKRGAANLLGGRAWRFTFYPLVYPEIEDFDLLKALNNGLVPSHYLATHPERSLEAYILDYLKEEIFEEGLAQNLPAFARFFDAVGYSQGELTNFTNISRDCGVDAKTIKAYYEILVDTLIGYFIWPYTDSKTRDTIIATPKFYMFDVGVANHLAKRIITELKGAQAGAAFEHYILMELIAFKGLRERNFDIAFWRTKSGHEVDFILGNGEIAIEVKITDRIDRSDLKGLLAFSKTYKPKMAYLVCRIPRARKIIVEDGTDITAIPWHEFLKLLWDDKII
jgi:predicted AAA+ superfamily ATPase